jgi:hypothetical protein
MLSFCILVRSTYLQSFHSSQAIVFKFNNTHQLDTLHIHFHFIQTQNLDMFRISLAHPQEALHEHNFGVCSVLYQHTTPTKIVFV